MKTLYSTIALCLIAFSIILSSCNKNNDDLVPSILVDPSDVNLLAKLIKLPSNGLLKKGNLPGASNSFKCSVIASNITSSNGSSSPILLQCNGFKGKLKGVYMQIKGSDTYFDIPVENILNGFVSLPLLLPTNLLAGNFCVDVIAIDESGSTSTIANQCIEVLTQIEH
jgi:hypothetical protein